MIPEKLPIKEWKGHSRLIAINLPINFDYGKTQNEIYLRYNAYPDQQAEIDQIKKQYAIDVCKINQFYFPLPICGNQPPNITNLLNACLSCPMRETCKLLFTEPALVAAKEIK